jgi:hypothetical protein
MHAAKLIFSLTCLSAAILTGCGGGTVSTTPAAVTASALTLSATSLTFASQGTGTSSAAQTVTATNTGSATLTFGSITLGGTNATSFNLTTSCTAPLAAGASCTASVTFAPAVAGALTASLIFTDSAANSPQTVALTGTATTGSAGAPASTIYVVQNNPTTGASLVLEFAATANGANVTPFATLTAPTAVAFSAVALDTAGNLYVGASAEILVYAPGATGTATPIRTIIGSATTLLGAVAAISVDASGQIYESNASQASIGIFAAGSNGNVAPVRTIAGTSTLVTGATSFALDAANNLYVANLVPSTGYTAASSQILVFSPTANGNVAPTRTIAGISTSLSNFAFGIAVDGAGTIYATTITLGTSSILSTSILEYAATANGNVAPIKAIGGTLTGFNTAILGGMRVDTAGNIYALVQNLASSIPSLVIYAPTASGNVAPGATIASSAWNGTNSGQIAIR